MQKKGLLKMTVPFLRLKTANKKLYMSLNLLTENEIKIDQTANMRVFFLK